MQNEEEEDSAQALRPIAWEFIPCTLTSLKSGHLPVMNHYAIS